MSTNIARSVFFCGSFLAALAVSSAADAKKPLFGSGEVLASIGAEAAYCAGQPGCNGGFPEGVVVDGSRVYVAGPATFGTAGKGPSVVTVLKLGNGKLEAEIPIQGEATEFEHALSGITADGRGGIYALSTQLGVVRLERKGKKYLQSSYSPPLPDLPVCVPEGPSPCAPTFVDFPPLSNEMTFDEEGNLYITDSLQATIWRVPAGGGSIEPWFQSALLAGNLAGPLPFGVNGIKVGPDRDYLYLTVSLDPADVTLGRVYRLPLVEAPVEEELELFHTFGGAVVPDSLVFGQSGRLYVSLAQSNQIAVLDEDGGEVVRISGPSGSAIPMDGPATMAFDDAKKSLLVANHAIFGDPSHFAILRIHVGEKGDPLPEPCGL